MNLQQTLDQHNWRARYIACGRSVIQIQIYEQGISGEHAITPMYTNIGSSL